MEVSERTAPGGDERDGPRPADPTAHHLARAAAGDQASLEWLIETFTPAMLAAAHRCCSPAHGPAGDPEDAVQEVWVRTLAKLASLSVRSERGSRDLLSYLGRAVLNHYIHVARDVRRRRGRSLSRGSESSATALVERLRASTVGVVTRTSTRESSRALMAVLDRLDPLDQEILVLRGLQQVSNLETATILGESPSLVSARYNRALDKARRLLPGTVLDWL